MIALHGFLATAELLFILVIFVLHRLANATQNMDTATRQFNPSISQQTNQKLFTVC